jgi:hypothetical protein
VTVSVGGAVVVDVPVDGLVASRSSSSHVRGVEVADGVGAASAALVVTGTGVRSALHPDTVTSPAATARHTPRVERRRRVGCGIGLPGGTTVAGAHDPTVDGGR